jgi:hypothetical protein
MNILHKKARTTVYSRELLVKMVRGKGMYVEEAVA